MAQQILVFAIVAIALVYAGWKLLPGAVTKRVAAALIARARAAGVAGDRLARWERRLSPKACGACDSCDGCGPAPAANPDGKSVMRFQRMP